MHDLASSADVAQSSADAIINYSGTDTMQKCPSVYLITFDSVHLHRIYFKFDKRIKHLSCAGRQAITSDRCAVFIATHFDSSNKRAVILHCLYFFSKSHFSG